MKIMNEVSYLGAHDQDVDTIALDDPQLFKYPVAYIICLLYTSPSPRDS